MPTIIRGSISILSDAGLGMAMFSLGIFFSIFAELNYLNFPPERSNRRDIDFFFFLEKGLFMALQPKIIACGKSVAAFSMAVRFLTGPAVIAATSIAIGIRGVLLHVVIVQVLLQIINRLLNVIKKNLKLKILFQNPSIGTH